MVFNGCIYNHLELRAGARARRATRSPRPRDTEVLLKGWAAWGEGVLDRLKGMFAFALVEHDSGRVVLARDRLGVKPLYLADLPGGGLRFASTLPALLAAGDVDTDVDPVALHHYLCLHSIVPAPRTILRGVGKLPPATVLIVEPDGTPPRAPLLGPAVRARPRACRLGRATTGPRRVHEALRTAVERRMVADVPVGILLSGGLDSSLIVALLAESGQRGLADVLGRLPRRGRPRGRRVRVLGPRGARVRTDHHKIRVEPDRLLPALAAGDRTP